jgi:uncharacterized membrane protein
MEYVVVLKYLAVLAFFASLGAPVAALRFRDPPRRGAPLSLLAASIPFAIVVSWVGQATFGLHTLRFAVGVLVAGSLLAYRLGANPHWRAVAGADGVYVGSPERDRYGESVRSFDRQAFSESFSTQKVTVYQVDHSELDAENSRPDVV